VSAAGPRVLVVTTVHRPDDARILHRGIASLRAAGMVVTAAAPWAATGTPTPEGLATRELPRASGRRRFAALRAAARLLRAEAGAHDLVLLHDPELLLAARWVGLHRLPPVVWDVHEDAAAALRHRAWVPAPLRPVLAGSVRRLEGWAERHVHLVLAEERYRDRFRRPHPVVRNLPWAAVAAGASAEPVGPDGVGRGGDLPRVVHVGRLSRGRGLEGMLELGRRLGPVAVVELVGDVDAELRADLEAAVAAGDVRWHGFLPADRAAGLIAGARVGLCLLADEPNYRVSLPSKVVEYLAHGVPVVATPLPEVARLLEGGGGTLVAFGDVDAAERAVRRYLDDASAHARDVARARAVAAVLTWEAEGERLVAALRTWAAPGSSAGSPAGSSAGSVA
jgi:glycosyltransferase involved in cell wall biosynthesis